MITEVKLWESFVIANEDGYGKAVVDVCRKVMEFLDDDCDLSDVSNLICKADKAVEAGGITGFMAGVVASVVSQVHSRGKEFQKAWNASFGVEDDADGTVNPAILTIKTN